MPLPGIQSLPAGVVLRPLLVSDLPPLVALAMTEASPPAFILLRETADAFVYAGAVTDGENRVLQWLEVWVQRVAASPFFHLGNTGPAPGERDARWAELRNAMTDAGDGRVFSTGREETPFPPVRWGTDGQPLTPEEPAGEGVPIFNPEGGHVFFRYAAPFSAADYSIAVSSGQLPQASPRMNSVTLQTLRDIRHQPGYYLRAWHGETPPVAEILHLKLSLLLGIFQATEAAMRTRRLPLLNLKTRSFGLEWAGERSGLALWTVQPVLDFPSAATRWLAGGDADDPVFLLAEEPPASIYRHPDITAPRIVRGNVRLSQLRAAGSQKDHLETEGTLILTEPLPRATDTVLIHCPLAAHPIQAVITSLEPSRGEVVFRSARWKPAPGIAASIASGGQAPPPMDCDCALVPRLSAPADLYALGVIALEVLCGGSGQGLPMIVDEALRMAQRLGQEKIALDAIPDTLAGWQRREPDANWTTVLASRHLASPAPDADTASRMVPPVAWYSALTWAIRLLTGSCSQAYFQSPGEGSAQSPHLALEQPLKDLRFLLHRTRALVTIEWKANLEIRDQIMAVMEK
ncbi:MAG TPA: hypothetical protein VG796_27515 [Verrucomicrobiales bacterium]|nr:hypothetical protein [Verrucomicrobiales bacterium]